MTKIRVVKEDPKPKSGDERLMDVARRAGGFVLSFIGLAIGILGALLLSRSFTFATFFLHSLPLFTISLVLIVQGVATGRGLTWREALSLLMDTLNFV